MEMVGDGQSPNYFFVTNAVSGMVIATFLSLSDARVFGDYLEYTDAPCFIEDRQEGIVWESRAAIRYQQALEDAELQ